MIEDRTIRVNDDNYYYSIAIPYDYNENNTYPIFIALHWGGNANFQSGANFLQTFALEALEDFKGFIISPSCPEAAGWIHKNSEDLIFSIIDKMKTDYNIDDERIVIGGYSMGGIGTWYYAVTYPDVFKVAVPISSMPPNYMRPIKDVIPIYIIHGENDEVFSMQNVDDLVREVKIYGNIIKLIEIDNASHYETNKFIVPLAQSLEWVESYLE
jgi:predicted peptidase